MKLFLKILLLLIIAVVFDGTLVFLYRKSQEKPVIFETRSPFVTNIVKKTVATGSILPRKEIDIKPRSQAFLKKSLWNPEIQLKKTI